MDKKDIIAGWGAILSTILALLRIIEFLKDKASVKVKLQGGYKSVGVQIGSDYVGKNINSPYGDATLLSIIVFNKGKRPVTITKASLLLPRKLKEYKYAVCGDTITALSPIELTEGKSHTYNMNEDNFKKQYELTPDKYIACVKSATGKTYWSHNIFKRLWKLHRIG